jgi:hypothetical protein
MMRGGRPAARREARRRLLNEVLTDKIWGGVAKRARSAPTRKTAIAYVTTDAQVSHRLAR